MQQQLASLLASVFPTGLVSVQEVNDCLHGLYFSLGEAVILEETASLLGLGYRVGADVATHLFLLFL